MGAKKQNGDSSQEKVLKNNSLNTIKDSKDLLEPITDIYSDPDDRVDAA